MVITIKNLKDLEALKDVIILKASLSPIRAMIETGKGKKNEYGSKSTKKTRYYECDCRQ